MTRKRAGIAFATLLAIGAGDAGAQSITCNAPQKAMMDVELLFGRNVGDKLVVTDTRWNEFLIREVTPRFPDGLTVFDTSGQMRSKKTKTVTQEPSKIVRIITRAEPEAQAKIDEIVTAYKVQFKQESVGIVMRPACVSF